MWVIASLCSLVIDVNVLAGSVSGPYVVWVNLDANQGKQVDDVLKKYLNQKNRDCFEYYKEPILYMQDRPANISNELVYDAFVKGNLEAIATLNKKLIDFVDEDGDGLDGVMVYSSKPRPRIMSLTTPRNYKKKIKTIYLQEPISDTAVQAAFCAVVPPITRAP